MSPRTRLKLLVLLFLLGSVLTAVAFACGSSGGAPSPAGEAGVQGEGGGDGDAGGDGGAATDANQPADAGTDAFPPDAACPTGHAGDLDTTYGDNGFLTFKGILTSGAYAVVEQPDGKLLVGGAHYSGINRFTVIRLLPNGDLDATFGTFGIASVRVGVIRTPELPETIFALALQPDGKIVAAGNAASTDDAGAYDVALARYLPDGRVDTTFGSGGSVLTDFNHKDDYATSVVLTPDGRIVVAGSAGNGTPADFAVARYNASGSLDPTFGTAGRVIVDFHGTQDHAGAVVVTPDAKMIVGGSSDIAPGAGTQAALLRLAPTGAIDPTFGDGGKLLSSRGELILALSLAGDGGLLAAGSASNQLGLVRMTAAGIVDTSFGDGGAVSTRMGSNSAACAVWARGDDRIELAGYALNATRDQQGAALVSYTSAGTLDSSYGDGGQTVVYPVVTTDFGARAAVRTRCFTYLVGPYDYVIGGSIHLTTWGVARFYR